MLSVVDREGTRAFVSVTCLTSVTQCSGKMSEGSK
jgi:hypothetical protein